MKLNLQPLPPAYSLLKSGEIRSPAYGQFIAPGSARSNGRMTLCAFTLWEKFGPVRCFTLHIAPSSAPKGELGGELTFQSLN